MRILVHLLLLAGSSLAAPSRRANHVLHEKRAAEPVDWALSRRLEPDHHLSLRIGLTQTNLHELEEHLMDVSHPESPNYGKHWTPAQVVDKFAPKAETIDAVKIWLTEAGFAPERMKLSPSKGWLKVNATAAEVEDLLQTEYHVYTHESGVEQIGCHSYSLPEYIRKHVDIVQPSVHFMHRVPKSFLNKRSLPTSRLRNIGTGSQSGPKTLGQKVTITPNLENCDELVTPDCLRALYNITYTPVATDKNTYGIVEFTPQAFLQGDLDLFFTNFSTSQVGDTPIFVAIDGGVAQTTDQSFDFNGESDLDLEYAMSLTNPQPITLLQTGDLVEGASFNNWLDAVDGSFCTFEGGDDPTQDGIYPDTLPGGFDEPESCGILAPPNVVSVSYGQDEASVTAAYANRQCAEYGKIGLTGTTVLYSSGDNGVAGNNGECLNSKGRASRTGTIFNPGFPVTCPFLTAVGATQIDPGKTVNDPEGACEQVIFSGGGFSNIFAMPSYQIAAVESFLAKNKPDFSTSLFNSSGKSRAFPDLSANGANYVIGIDGEFELVFGTSASSPVTGSIITLVNDARIAAGKSPVGFINPTIYLPAFAEGFNDITHGGNQGCNTGGFNATIGWDPVTGVGTPNLGKLLELWLALS